MDPDLEIDYDKAREIIYGITLRRVEGTVPARGHARPEGRLREGPPSGRPGLSWRARL